MEQDKRIFGMSKFVLALATVILVACLLTISFESDRIHNQQVEILRREEKIAKYESRMSNLRWRVHELEAYADSLTVYLESTRISQQ